MTRGLSATTTLAAQRPHARPRYLLEIEFSSPATYTLLLSDQYLDLGGEWLAYVESWGAVEEALNTLDAGGRPATFEVALLNTRPVAGKDRLSDLVRTPENIVGSYYWAFAKATLYELLSPAHGVNDRVALGVFYLEDPTEFGEELLRVRMSDHSAVMESQINLVKIGPDTFPNADPDDVGKYIPVVFGALTNVPAYAVVAGAHTTLAAAAVAGATSLTVSSAAAFPAVPFTMQIDDEQKTVVGKTTTTLTLSAGLSAAHVRGAVIFEVRSGANAYVFVLGENKPPHYTKSVSAVYINGVRTTAGAVNLDNASLITGRSFVTVSFASVPWIAPQGTVDSIAVSSPSISSSKRIATNTPVTVTLTLALFGPRSGSASGGIGMPAAPPGAIVDVKRRITYRVVQSSITTTSWSISAAGRVLESGTSFPVLGSRSFLWGSGTSYGGDTLTVSAVSASGSGTGGTIQIVIDAYEADVETQVTVTKSGTVTLSGNSAADVLFGQVTADVEGLKDDTSGTITGTAAQLLEVPADVTRVALTTCWPGVASIDLGMSWLTTRASQVTAGYKWAFLLGATSTKFADLRRAFGEQGRAVLAPEGDLWEYRYLDDAPAIVQTLDYTRDVERAGAPRRTARSEIKNSLSVYSQRDYTESGALGEQYKRMTTVEDLTQGVPRQPGATEDDRQKADLVLDLVQDETTAAALGAFWLNEWKRQRFLLEDVVGFWNLLDLVKGDHVAFTNHPGLTAHGGSGLAFRVTGKRYLPGGQIGLRLLEAAA